MGGVTAGVDVAGLPLLDAKLAERRMGGLDGKLGKRGGPGGGALLFVAMLPAC